MCVLRNIVQPLLQWKNYIIMHSECALVTLGIQDAMRLRHNIICDLSGCSLFFHIIS
jgi:hypothetical protein